MATPKELFATVIAGLLSPKSFRLLTGGSFVVRSGGYRDNSKWSINELRAMRARNGVGRPPAVIASRREAQAAQ